jgi:hypothetical protein
VRVREDSVGAEPGGDEHRECDECVSSHVVTESTRFEQDQLPALEEPPESSVKRG